MSTELITAEIWPLLTQTVRATKQECLAAVAYFGAGARGLLPMPSGSRLVVDASERAVVSGQTCPSELAALVASGVRVFSVPNLHAKVFVLGRAAFIGSANVSGRSASQLVEAVVRTTERKAVRAAREFVRELCLHELTPTVLKRLAKIYRPPKIPGGTRLGDAKKATARRPSLPRLVVTRLRLQNWPEPDMKLHARGEATAEKQRKHPRDYEMESFRWSGKCPCGRGDVVIQVTEEGAGKVLVSPPSNVLHVHTRRGGKRPISFVYVERPNRRRRHLAALERKLGSAGSKRLQRSGEIRDAALAQAILGVWAD